MRVALTCGLPRERVAVDLEIGRSTLRKWLAQYRPSDLTSAPQADLARENERLRLEIREQYSLSLDSYGRPRMTMELKEVGLDVSERRVGRLMKINRIKPVRTRRQKVITDSHHRLGVAANWLDGDFVAAAPNQKWAGDITNIWMHEGWPTWPSPLICIGDRRKAGFRDETAEPPIEPDTPALAGPAWFGLRR